MSGPTADERPANGRPASIRPGGALRWVGAVLIDLLAITALTIPVTALVAVPLGRRILEWLSAERPGMGLEGVALAVVILLAICWGVSALAYVVIGIRAGGTPGMRAMARVRS